MINGETHAARIRVSPTIVFFTVDDKGAPTIVFFLRFFVVFIWEL